jgi:hypothetical protein
MRTLLAVVSLLGLASCAGPGTSEDFKWTVDCPKSVERGAEFGFTVRTAKGSAGEVAGVAFRYEITWAPGSGSPLRQKGSSGTAVKAHARVLQGPATLVISAENREGQAVKVAEAAFEVR